jgi:hypothetical protein
MTSTTELATLIFQSCRQGRHIDSRRPDHARRLPVEHPGAGERRRQLDLEQFEVALNRVV